MRMPDEFASTATFKLGLLASFFALTCYLHGQTPFGKTTICMALSHPERFDGKRVEVHAKYAATFEGAWLTDDRCNWAGELVLPSDHNLAMRYGIDDVLTRLSERHGINDVVRDKAWKQFDFSRRHLYTGMTLPTEGCSDYVTADFSGFLIIKRNFRVKNGFGNGWGHLGGSSFLLVVRSVSNVSPHPCAGTSDGSSPN